MFGEYVRVADLQVLWVVGVQKMGWGLKCPSLDDFGSY
jgi:hypothetical protein